MNKLINIIAEIGSVHDGSFGNACKLIEAAANCGASTVKFQTHISSAETLASAPSPGYFSGETRFDYFDRTAFSKAQWYELKSICKANQVGFLSSPFSIEAVDLLAEIDVDGYKIPSGEVTNIPMLERLAAVGKPVILSSGMSDWRELDQAVKVLSDRVPLELMQCTSAYPCPPEKVGLNIIGEMQERYPDLQIGFSDHTESPAAAVAAVTLGVSSVEKHFTFSRLMYGSDAQFAMEPAEFAQYCTLVSQTEAMLSSPVNKDDVSSYKNMKSVFEKSIVAANDLRTGAVLSVGDFAYKKPGTGLSAASYKDYIGKKLRQDVAKDHMFTEQDFE